MGEVQRTTGRDIFDAAHIINHYGGWGKFKTAMPALYEDFIEASRKILEDVIAGEYDQVLDEALFPAEYAKKILKKNL